MRVLYLFSGSREGILEKVAKGEMHKNGFWGMLYLPEFGIEANYLEPENSLPRWLARFVRNRVNVYFAHILFFWKIFSYDAVFTSAAFGTQLVHTLLGFRRPKWVMHDFSITGLLGERKTFQQKIFSYMVKRSAGIVTVSRDEKDRLENMYPNLRGRIKYIPFGVDLEFFKPKVAEERLQILGVGFDPDRDWHTLIEATRSLGVPVIMATREKRVKKLMPLPHHCSVKQFTPRELVEEYSRSAVVVIPLDTSGRNNDAMGCSALFEGMAMARPVVITRTRATESYVQDGENGVLVEEKDAADLTKALKRLLEDKDLRGQMGRNARTYAEHNLDARDCSVKLADFLKNICSAKD